MVIEKCFHINLKVLLERILRSVFPIIAQPNVVVVGGGGHL